jgi:hypothetical protein
MGVNILCPMQRGLDVRNFSHSLWLIVEEARR